VDSNASCAREVERNYGRVRFLLGCGAHAPQTRPQACSAQSPLYPRIETDRPTPRRDSSVHISGNTHPILYLGFGCSVRCNQIKRRLHTAMEPLIKSGSLDSLRFTLFLGGFPAFWGAFRRAEANGSVYASVRRPERHRSD